jgi:hypothetical protein
MKHSIEIIKDKLKDKVKPEVRITDNEIVALDKNLKNEKINVSDLFE